MNKVLLVGRLVRDAEVKSTASGIKNARFTIAVDRQFGEKEADFIPIIAWKHDAEFVEKYINKGSLVSIEGRFSSSTYEKDGQKVTKYEVTAEHVKGLESKAQAEARTGSSTPEVKREDPKTSASHATSNSNAYNLDL